MTRVFFSFHVPVPSGELILRDLAALPVVCYTPENLHVTLRFIGDVSPLEEAQLRTAAQEIAAEHSSIIFKPLHFDIQDGRVRLYVDGGERLMLLHTHLVAALEELHIGKPDPKPYRPHITLARTNSTVALPSSRTAYAFEKNTFGLYKSEPGEKRMGVYTMLHDFPLSH